MLRKIDLWIGRHMDVKRWIVLWMSLVVACHGLMWTGCFWIGLQSWVVYTFCPIGVILGSIMAWGNLRRLR